MKGDRKLMQLHTLLLFALIFFFQLSFYAQTDTGIKTAKDAVYGEEGVDVLYSHTAGMLSLIHI